MHFIILGTPAGRTPVASMKRSYSMSKKQVIATDKAALPVGPYSQAVEAGGFIFVAGEKGLDPKTGKIVEGGIAAETRQTLENVKAILEEAGASMDDAVRSVVYMTDMGQFAEMNGVYAEYFTVDPPPRSCVQVVALPAGAHVEIEITAVR
jgi:2-iminobutanoate/2-iminopropanoate deaminase